MSLKLKVRRLEHAAGLPVPERASPGSAGLDLRAASADELRLHPGERALVSTGFAIEVPPGWEGQVRPRSGLASKHGVTVVNAPGTIDCDYRGEVMVALVNLGSEPYWIRRGDRIAQLLLAPVPQVEVVEVDKLSETPRGSDGFGSTGRS